MDHHEQIDQETIATDLSRFAQCTIAVFGTVTETYRRLLDPLIFKQSEEDSKF